MIDFTLKDKESKYSPDDKEIYFKFIKDICSSIEKSTLDKYELGYKLIDFYKSGRYGYKVGKDLLMICNSVNPVFNLHQNNFFAVCELEFGLEKSSVSRLMNVVDEFGNGSNGLKKEFSKYKYSVLVEMLNLSADERKGVMSEWTVSQVRDYKKKLVATSQQENEMEGLEPAPKEEYPQFKKWKRNDLCRRIVELEQEIERLKKQE